MRWFKHLTMAHADPALSTLAEEMGAEAYGIYWLLLEHFAAAMEKNCVAVPALIHSETRWAEVCRCSTRRLRAFVDRASNLRLICVESAPELRQYCGKRASKRFQICIPKLLKYRDEYSQRSGQTPDKLRPRSDTERDKSRVETPPTPSPEGERVETPPEPPIEPPKPVLVPKPVPRIEQEFEEDWPQFWVQLGKKSARKAYAKARGEISRDGLMQAVRAQGPPILQRARATGSTPVYPATWLNDGRYGDNQRHLEGLAAVPARASPQSRREKANQEFEQRVLREARERENESLDFTGGS